jgi:hypothetical protein
LHFGNVVKVLGTLAEAVLALDLWSQQSTEIILFLVASSVGRDRWMMTLKQEDTIRYDLRSRYCWFDTKTVNLENVSFKSQDRDF